MHAHAFKIADPAAKNHMGAPPEVSRFVQIETP